jgi:hypothetical protein
VTAPDPLRAELAELLGYTDTRPGHTQLIHADTIRSLLAQYPAQEQPATVVALSSDPADRAAAVQRVADAMHAEWQRQHIPTVLPWSSLWMDLAAAAIAELEQPPADEWPPGSCPGCGHRWADHDEHDGCGACAMEFVRSCKRWPQ